MTFSGIPIYVSDYLPKTKTIRWKTERKWCHWKNAPSLRYRLRSKEVPCDTVIMLGGRAFVSPEGFAKIQGQLGKAEQ
ncbi:MAG TPA: hypothetical protein VJS90_05340 [Pseudomonas sp.]|uniref:hypothetical protein n=1 Tax=Pseudomonas sp. TaxID=306 RepID=UPI002B49F636|nr:hypothetical protein [Pseudomonas sp.]HKS12444.1 hypothetical protein [Pseudomonas sp.]